MRLDHDTLCVEVENERLLQVPFHHIGAVVLFGTASMSPRAMGRCVAEGREVTFLDFSGRFLCRVVGPTTGSVLLRQAQQEALRRPEQRLAIARHMVGAKIRNSRHTLLRGARDASDNARQHLLRSAAMPLADILATLPDCETLDEVRGKEGESAAHYFAAFGALIAGSRGEFAFRTRTRRPPRDRVNALLSFMYALLAADCTAAIHGVGLDCQFGFLHGIRPGRPSLALDLMEEFRSGIADRLALTLINRRQIRPAHFDVRDEAGDTVMLNEEGRKIVLTAYQTRKQETIPHRLLKTEVAVGLVPHLQARLLARHLRGDIPEYQPFLFG